MQRILVLYLTRLNEAIECTPLLATLKTAIPDAAITILATTRISQLIAACPGVDEVVFFDTEPLAAALERDDTSGFLLGWETVQRLTSQLRSRTFSLVINLDAGRTGAVIARLIAGQQTRGATLSEDWMYVVRGAWPTYANAIINHGLPQLFHPADVMRRFGAPAPGGANRPLFYIGAQDREFIRLWLAEQRLAEARRFVVISVNTTATSLALSVESFSELADKVIDTLHLPVVLAGSETDRKLGDLIAAGMRHTPAMLFMNLSLSQWAALFERTFIVVTGVSNMLYIASTTPAHIVTIHPLPGKTPAALPYGEGHVIITGHQGDTSGTTTILPRHILVAVNMILRYSAGTLSQADPPPELAGATFQITHFDACGFLEQIPVFRYPLHPSQVAATLLRTVLRDSLDGAVCQSQALRHAVQSLLETSSYDPSQMSAAVQAIAPPLQQFALLCDSGRIKAHTLVELCSAHGGPAMQRTLAGISRELSDLDRQIGSLGSTHDVTRPLAILFTAEKENIEGSSIEHIARETLNLYQRGLLRARSLIEGADIALRLVRSSE